MRVLWLATIVAGCASAPDLPPCGAPTPDPGDPIVFGSGASATVYWSSESAPFDVDHPDRAWFECPRTIAHAFERRPDVAITANDSSDAIQIDPTQAFQTILGVGTSIEEASVANLIALPASTRDEVLHRMFDHVGLSIVRVTMGTSDFTGSTWYSYDDGLPDPALDRFSTDRDVDLGIVGVLQQIRAIAPDVVFFASPWSPPAWMKHGDTLTGGSLDDDDIPILAAYFRRFVDAYRDLGIPIAAITLQNEPEADNPAMPSCVVSPEQEAALAIATKREFATAGLATSVWIYDHNFDDAVDYTERAFAIAGARAAVDGVAFHDYAGYPSAIGDVEARFPEQQMVFTEKMLWGVAGVDRAAQYFRNGSISYVSWVTMLDQDGKPNNGPNTDKPRRFVRAGDGYWATPEHFLFALYSRLVAPGARRIASSYGDPAHVTDVAFANPDGAIVVVVANQTASSQDVVLQIGRRQIATSLDAKTAAAYTWRPDELALTP